MFVLDCNIKIGKFEFNRVHEVTIVKSVDLLSDTAVIKMPASALFGNEEKGFEKKRLESEIKAGDKVEITLEYKDVFKKTEFVGFVKSIKPNTPIVEIQCEDAIYIVRKKRINKNFGKTNLKEVLTFILDGSGVTIGDKIPAMPFDSFLIKNLNGAQALEKIKEKYRLSIFVDDDNKLFASLKETYNNGKIVKYDFYKNIIKHNIQFRRKEDIRLSVEVTGYKKDNTTIKIFIGDTDGEKRELRFRNITDKETLKKIAEEEYEKLKVNGYKGKITSFLVPYATRGMGAEIKDKNFPDRKGLYFIPKVTTTFGQNGARRIVELGSKLN
jgi:hypothetical protein